MQYPRYNLDLVKKQLETEYSHSMYRVFIGNILGLCRDTNLNNIDINKPLDYFNGQTALQVLKFFNIPTIK